MKKLVLIAVATVLVWSFGVGEVDAELAKSRPNIILVITDDQGYGPVGRHGHPWIKTPHLDAMHDESVRMTRYLVAPTCSPTRAALMTGRHPMRNGITHTILERERMTLNATTLPQVLVEVGYATGMFGKWHLGDEKDYRPAARGFQEVFQHGAGGIGQAYACSCADAPGNKYFDPVILHNESFVKTKGYCTDLFFEAALGWIDGVKDGEKPFFAYISTNAPHGPFIAPPSNTKRFTDLGFPEKCAGFYGMIENIDENMGLLFEKLEEWELMEDTMVIFMSDNGMTGGGSGRGVISTGPDGTKYEAFNAGQKGQKGSTDEGGVRVPFFVQWEGTLKAGQDVDAVAAHIDLFPTLAELAGARLPEGQVEGRSFVSLLADPEAEWEDRLLVTHKGRWKTGRAAGDKMKNFAVRSERYRFVQGSGLFDMIEDPGQTKDLSKEKPELLESMLTFYEGWWDETLPLMVNEDAPMSPVRPFHEMYKAQMGAGGIPEWEAPEL